jgi:predicted dehydrogenase
MTFSILGDGGKLYLNNDDEEWRYWRLEDGEHVETAHPDVAEGWSWDVDYEAAFPNAAAHAVELLEGTAENRSPGTAAVQALEVIAAIYISHYTGSQVELPLEAPLRDVTITSW